MKYSLVALLPDLPESETWQYRPDVIEDGVVKGNAVPVSDRVVDAALVFAGFAH